MKRMLALVVMLGLASPVAAKVSQDPTMAGEFAHGLPLGTEVRLIISNGGRDEKLRGTIIATADDAIVVRPRVRIPEPPRRVPLREIADADIVRGASVGQAVAIGVGAGAATFFGILLAMLATLD